MDSVPFFRPTYSCKLQSAVCTTPFMKVLTRFNTYLCIHDTFCLCRHLAHSHSLQECCCLCLVRVWRAVLWSWGPPLRLWAPPWLSYSLLLTKVSSRVGTAKEWYLLYSLHNIHCIGARSQNYADTAVNIKFSPYSDALYMHACNDNYTGIPASDTTVLGGTL